MNQKPLPSTEEIAHHLTKKLIENLPTIVDSLKQGPPYVLAIGSAVHLNTLVAGSAITEDVREMTADFMLGWIATEVDSMINPKP